LQHVALPLGGVDNRHGLQGQ